MERREKILMMVCRGIAFDRTDGTLYVCLAQVMENAPPQLVMLYSDDPEQFESVAAMSAEENLYAFHGLLALRTVFVADMGIRGEAP